MTTKGTGDHPRLYVVILNWNSWKDTVTCLESVFRNEYRDYRVIVCDNDSSDGSLEFIKAWAEGRLEAEVPPGVLRRLSLLPIQKPILYVEYDRKDAGQNEAARPSVPLILIQTGRNLGYGGGNNVALKYVFGCDPEAYALILNNDVVISRDFLARAIDVAFAGPAQGAAVVGFPAYLYDEPGRLECAYIQDQFSRGPVHISVLPEPEKRSLDKAMVHGAAMIITPDAPVKLLPEEYFLYYEDADYCRQVRKHGGNIWIQLDNPVYHRVSRTVGANSPVQTYYTRRSKLTYCRKYSSSIEYSIVLVRMLYSTLTGWARCFVRADHASAKAYLLSYWHHLRGKKGRTWI